VKDTLPLITLKIFPHPYSRFEHTYPVVLATFWSSSGSPLSWVSLVALSSLPRCPESIEKFTFHGHFDFGEEPEVARCQIRWIRWMRTHRNILFDRNCRTRSDVCTELCHDGGWNRLPISQVVFYAHCSLNALISPL